MIALERRLEAPRAVRLAAPLGAVVVALLATAALLLVSGHDPVAAFRAMFQASVSNEGAFSSTLVNATPLVFTGLAAAIAFRLRAWNIGGEGQLVVGAVAAAGAALALGGQPGPVIIAGTIAAAAVAGGVWAAVPGLLRVRFGANEVLTTLMFNYIGALVASYLIFSSRSYWRDLVSPSAQAFPSGKTIDEAGWWPALTLGSVTVPFGFVAGLAIVVALTVLLRWTRFGFELRTIADAPEAGRYAGMRTGHVFVVTMLLSGALAGLAGASQVGDFTHTLEPRGLGQAAFGYAGIVVAALAAYSPGMVVVFAIFIGGLSNAAYQLQGASFPAGLAGVMQGLILFCILSAGLFVRYRLRVGRRAAEPSPAPVPAPAALDTSSRA